MAVPRYFMSLDFGTYASGFAYADPDGNVNTYWDYPSAPPAAPYPKNLTSLLYEVKPGECFGAPKAWGWHAKETYMQMKPDERRRHVYQDNFKLSLASGIGFDDLWQQHEGLPASKLIADYLKELSTMAKKILQKSSFNAITSDQIRWAITIPAEWSNASMGIMRQAALEAGITTSLGSNSLVLLYEPEAAALYAKSKEDVVLREGSVFIVIDAGGGTTDITMHNVQKKDAQTVLGEAAHRAGLMIGGNLLDKEYEDIWRDRLGNEWDAWKNDHTTHFRYLEHMENIWKGIKVRYTMGESMKQDKNLHLLEMPKTLHKRLDQKTLKLLKEVGDGENDYNFSLTSEALRSMFQGVADKIIAATRDVIRRSKKEPDVILLVGGLGTNNYLAERVQESFAAHVCTPTYGHVAVLSGGVLYAKNPREIATRCSRYTYGLETGGEWQVGDPPTDYRKPETNQLWCRNIFNTIVLKDQIIAVDAKHLHSFTAATREQASVIFKIYCTENKNPRHTQENGMHLMGSMNLVIEDPTAIQDPSKYVFDVTLRFGGTEFIVTALDKQTGKEEFVKVEFADTQSANLLGMSNLQINN